MKQRLLKLALLTFLTATMTGLSLASRADDTTKPATPADQTAKSKFYGSVTAVDTNAMTFTVGDQTFTVTSESQITKNGQTATLANAVVGEPARGSYTKSADGKLDVTKVRFGKKSGGKAGGKHKKSETPSTNTPASTPPTQ
jgi:hypothetical protein